MRTYHCEVKELYCNPEKKSIAAKTFTEAWTKLKRLMKKRRRRYSILSIVQTAVLDA